MEEIREIGIEKEMFLLDIDGKPVEPKLYGFPNDEMGFLVELRSWPAERLEPIEMSLNLEEIRYTHRADKFGMELRDYPNCEGKKKWVDYIADKYKIHESPDFTRNIYEDSRTHHLGILPTDYDDECYRLTSGLHVHFSSRNADTGEVLNLPIEIIVEQMDGVFDDDIIRTYRIPGEWEPKTHGFEYRSLPCDTNIHKVLRESFKILREV